MTATSSTPPRTSRILRAFAAVLLVLAPLGFVTSQFWLSSSRDTDTVRAERNGVEYLRPAIALIAVLTDAQSTAVRGQRVSQDAVLAAVRQVDRVDAELGVNLATTVRWTALRDRINQLVAKPASGARAYRDYSEAVDLTVALAAKVGDTSQLILDPELDSYYLMDAALLRLPVVLVETGRYSDLATLSSTAPFSVAIGYDDSAAAARYRISHSAAAADEGLRRSINATTNRELGPGLIAKIDDFRSAAAELAPLVELADSVQSRTPPADLKPRREQLDQATLELSEATLVELDILLSQRERDITDGRVTVLAAAVIGLLGAGWILVSLLPASRREDTSGTTDELTDEDDREPAPSDDSLLLLDARELLDRDHLVHVGRAVRRSRRRPEDDLP